MKKRIIALLLSLVLFAAGCASQNNAIRDTTDPETEAEHPLPGDSSLQAGGSTEVEPTVPPAPVDPVPPVVEEPSWPRKGDVLLTMTPEDIGLGYLVLVNNEHLYTLPADIEEQLTTIAEGKKSSSYRLRDYVTRVLPVTIEHLDEMMDAFAAQGGPTDVMVVSGWRDYETQQKLFDNSAARNGLEHANRFVAKRMGSEHHTGYAIDLWSCDKNDYLDYTAPHDWITDHCNEFGFILRYEKEKEPITGIGEETWHFRYLGLPHPWIVTENGFCYEEYIDYLRQFPYEGEHLLYDAPNGSSYEIYFVEGLEVPVPENGNYEVSGNNVDGFIVTVTK